MRVRILRSALNDLAVGREFYDRQAEGVGDYFFNSLFSDIDSLVLFGGIHRKTFEFHRLLASRFPFAILQNGHGWICDRVPCFGLPEGSRKDSSGIKIRRMNCGF